MLEACARLLTLSTEMPLVPLPAVVTVVYVVGNVLISKEAKLPLPRVQPNSQSVAPFRISVTGESSYGPIAKLSEDPGKEFITWLGVVPKPTDHKVMELLPTFAEYV
jgi:hypothetical protein